MRTIFTYFVQGERGGPIKIGKAIDPTKRLKELQTGFPYKLVLLLVLEGDREGEFHRRFADDRAHGEWFEPSPKLTRFILEEEGKGAVPGAGGLHRSPPPSPNLPLVFRHIMRKYEGDHWWSADFEGDDEDEDKVLTLYDELEEFHERRVGRGFSVCDQEDGGCLPDGACECESSMVFDAMCHLQHVPLHGLMFRNGLLEVLAIIRWPESRELREAIESEMEGAAFGLDAAEFQLHAILVNPDSTYTTVSMGDVYGGRLINPKLHDGDYGDDEWESAPAPAKGVAK